MFSHKPGSSIVIDDELQRFVEEAVLTVTVPVLVCALFEGDRRSIIETDDEGRGFNCF
jgi:hypothetical protein